VAVATEERKAAGQGTESHTASGTAADGPGLKSEEPKKPSAEPTTPVAEAKKPSKAPAAEEKQKPTDTAKAPSRPPRGEQKQPTADVEKPGNATAASEKQKPGREPAIESTQAAPPKTSAEPRPADSTSPKASDHADVATIVVRVPADAKVYFDDRPTQQTGEERTFVTPSLPPRRTFHYSLRTEVVSGGRIVSKIERVTVRAGETIAVEGVKPAPAIKER
jgi:uncharacterized protein (TIGR03000 family)